MSTELTVLGQTDIQKGGLGFGSKLFDLKPMNIELVQKMTRQEGAIPGKLRVTDTNQHFDEMQVVMLFTPIMQRACFQGEDFSKDSKICFSTDNVAPHHFAKIPQALQCKGCPQTLWDTWRKTKKRDDLPKCKEYYHLTLIDRVTQLPFYFNVRGKSIKPFENSMKQVARLIHLAKAQGQNPNIFDVSFKIYPVAQEKATYWTLGIKDVAMVKAEDRAKFGEIFLSFVNRKAEDIMAAENAAAEAEAEAATATADNNIPEGTMPPPATAGPIEGEIVI